MQLPPFHTTNEGLALALQNCGFQPKKVENRYTSKKLAELGYRNMEVMEAVKRARLDGKSGVVHFYFESTPELKSAIAAWDDQGKAFAEGRQVHLERPTPEDFMRMARQLFQCRKAWRASYMSRPAFYEERDGEPREIDKGAQGVEIVCPGFKLASEDLPEDKLARLGL